MSEYILYARDTTTGKTHPIDVSVEGTLGDLYEELSGPYEITFQGATLNVHSKDTTLADLSLCPESVIEYTPYIPLEVFQKKYLEFTERFEDDLDFKDICSNENITLQIVEDYLIHYNIWEGLTWNPNVTSEFIMKHRDKPWDWRNLVRHKAVTWDMIDTLLQFRIMLWTARSCNPNVTEDILRTYIDKSWGWWVLSCNKNIGIKFIIEHETKRWNWNVICNREDISLEDIIKYQLYNREYEYGHFINLSGRRDLTWDFVQRYKHVIDWDYNTMVAVNPNLTWNIIEDNLEECFTSWSHISNSPCITQDIIRENPGYPWVRKHSRTEESTGESKFKIMSSDPGLSFEYVMENPDEDWDWNALSCNTFADYRKKVCGV